jgi:Phospholipase_D-nuclease N-terminal
MLAVFNYPILDFFWTMFMFFLLIVWIWILTSVFMDIFRSPDMGGGAKALWFILVLFLPFLGVLVYLIARAGKMQEHRIREASDAQAQMYAYIKQTGRARPSRGQLDVAGRVVRDPHRLISCQRGSHGHPSWRPSGGRRRSWAC